MNIFVLDRDPKLAAQYHCDRHVVKMVLESAQLLSTYWRIRGESHDILYKPSHQAHPCQKWLHESWDNYKWTWWLFCYLAHEYTHRYGKNHQSWAKLGRFLRPVGDLQVPDIDSFSLAMPDECKTADPVESYRNYYRQHKAHIATWKYRPVPEWWEDHK